MIKLPLDRVAYANWDKTIDYYNTLSEPPREKIIEAEKLNRRIDRGDSEDDFVFLDKDEWEHIKTHRVDTNKMWRKFFERVQPKEENND